MKKFLNKTKSSFKDPPSSFPSQAQAQLQSPVSAQEDQQSRILPSPTALDVLRYRYHHGTNLGSIFVLERWLTPSMFLPACPGNSELVAVTSCLEELGHTATKSKWEKHWTSAVSDGDLEWLVNVARCTSVRLPIGYWTLGERFCVGTPFEGEVGEVYGGAWAAARELVTRARAWGLGVLIDFHALPGGANSDAHSGTGSGKAEFWGSRRYRELAKRCLGFLAEEVSRMDGVVGLQVVNEAAWGMEGMYAWYEEVLKIIGDIDDSIPVYISDGWDLERALQWANGRRGVRNPVVVDTHKYYTFGDKDRSQTPAEIISRIPNELSELDGKEGSLYDRGEAQVIIGEYSCVLDGQTWARVPPEEKEGYVMQFGRAQSSKWQERAGGAYFWTYKMDWMDGGEWGYREQVRKQNILPPPSLLLSGDEVRQRASRAQQRRGELASEARRSHEEYWSRACPGQHFEHERYSQGWDVGFSDAMSFFVMRADGGLGDRAGGGADRIGVEIWVKKRLTESGQRGAFVWEWEQGFRAGVRDFNRIVDI